MNQESSFTFSGVKAEDFINFIEDLPQDSPYKAVKLVETDRKVGSGNKASLLAGAVIGLLVSIGKDILKDLLKDYFKSLIAGKKYNAKYTIENDKQEKLEITLNNLNESELDEVIDKFQGNITKVNSDQL